MALTPLIELKDIEVTFDERKILNGFSLTVDSGQKLSLVGESSSGKSTLLKIMVGLIRPDRGLVKIFGRDLSRLSDGELRQVRQRIGMQFQSGALFDSMSVMENLKLARRESAHDQAAGLAADNPAEPLKLLAAVGLASAEGRQPFELSGGMRKRAARARALTTNPALAIFDEPTAGLDPVTSRRIINLIQSISDQSGATMILATTDVQVARHFSPNLLVLNQGRLWASDTIDHLRASQDIFVQKLLSRLL
ncbi:MAG: ATP-binding cassette domain-containing protein [Candidatus Adiutrix sp.]|jgi:phospholipid/cholesterol/gamma-HCH transport system ATP-binding protein|nr:ATP-binding cassette domain-containing protein [Candidatus Adiutrix sp.]